MGVQNDEKPTHGFRGDTRDRDTRTSSRETSFASTGTFVGICEAFCKINIVGQPEHGRAQARVLSGLLSRILPLLTRRMIINMIMSNRFLSGRRGGRDVVEHRDSRRFLTFSIREYILPSHTTERPTAENYPSKLAQRSIARFTIS